VDARLRLGCTTFLRLRLFVRESNGHARQHHWNDRRGTEYYRLGIGSFLIRGFDPVNDATEFGRELIPRIEAGAAAIDGMKAAE